VLTVALVLWGCSVHKTASGAAGAPSGVVSAGADTDRGVTATGITIGAVAYRQDSFAQFGLSSLGGRPVGDLLKPFVDDLNAHGGIGGRHVTLAVSEFSPLVPAEAQTACVDQADDKKVFVTLAEVSLTDDAQEKCLASRQTPVVTSNSSSLADLAADQGWVHQIAMSRDRMFKNWVDWLVASGTATPAAKIGLIHADTPEDDALATNVFVPYLRSKGLNVAAEATFGGLTIASAGSDANTAAARFRDAGVNLILPDLDFLRTFLFLNASGAMGSLAHYSVSDLGQMSLSVATSFYPDTFAGTKGITAYTNDITEAGPEPVSAALAACLAIYRTGGRTLPASGVARLAEEVQVAQFCQELGLVKEVASRAGRHLNRASFSAAFDQVTGWSPQAALTGPLSFGPGKFDGADSYRVITWQADCGGGNSCYREVAPFTKGRW
jgi:ABC-type branched-subunit amino acid transport system substrate-binding protein